MRLGSSAGLWADGRVFSLCHGSLSRSDLYRAGEGVHQNGVACEVGAQTSLTCLSSVLLPPSLPGKAQLFKDHAGRSVVSGGRDRQCRDSRNRDTRWEDITVPRVSGRGVQGQGGRNSDAGKGWQIYQITKWHMSGSPTALRGKNYKPIFQ